MTGVEDLRHAYEHGKKSPLYVLPTGGGKTAILCYIAEHATMKGSRVFILVHRKELLLQCSRHLAQLGVPHGRVMPGHSMTRDMIQVASVQTLIRRMDYYAAPDLIIIDEGHHAVAGSWRKIINHWPDAMLLGVTATPSRLDGKGLGVHAGGVYDSLVEGPTIRQLIDMGYLTQPIVYAPPTDIDMQGVKVSMGDYEKGEMDRRVDRPTITGSAVEHYRKLCSGVPAIAFCASIKHAHHVAEQFQQAGYRAECIDGNLSDTERKQVIDYLGSGKLDVLTSCDIVSEGTDIPVVGAAILLRPTMSEGLYLQQTGRSLRPYPGKEHSIILDHVGNCLRHGLPDDERKWTLDGVKRRSKRAKKDEEKDIKIKQCPRCYMVHPPAPICPNCGYIYQTNTREIEEKSGELHQITDAEKIQIAKERRRKIGQARTFEELQAVGAELGYKPGWAWFRWKSRQARANG